MVKAQEMQVYPEFLDSSGLLNDGHALRVRLDRDGYLFIRDLLPARAILAVRERLLAKAAVGGWLDPDSPVGAPASPIRRPHARIPRTATCASSVASGWMRNCIGYVSIQL
jgi:hypothetical protein